MSYTIDVYRRQLEPTRNLLHFFAYLSLFPQLVAGPIVRAVDLLPQPGNYSADNRWLGLERIALGLFKKVVIADNLAPVVNGLFAPDRAATLGGAECWLAASLFAIQILCDFSGYSDIAIGLARWMGYSFGENFLRPYSAVGLRDFWSRWHISLSTWFRDYVYIPLGGSRSASPLRRAANLWAVMLLSGLWHGANFTFIAWGALHAAYLSIERWTSWPERLPRHMAARLAGASLTFILTTLAWTFFRAESIAQALTFCRAMIASPLSGIERVAGLISPGGAIALAGFAAQGLTAVLSARTPFARWLASPALRLIAVAGALVIAIFLRGPGNAFIYFQF